MNINFSELFSKGYWAKFTKSDFWFGLDRLQLHGVDYSVLALGVVLAFMGIIFRFAAKQKKVPQTKDLIQRYSKIFISIGIAEIVWYLLRWQNTTFFGTHFVAGLILFVGLIWLGFVLRFHLRKYKVHLKEWEKESLKKKYLQMPTK